MPYVIYNSDRTAVGICKNNKVNDILNRLNSEAESEGYESPTVQNLKRQKVDLKNKIEQLKAERPKVSLKQFDLPDHVRTTLWEDVKRMERYASVEFNKQMASALENLQVVEEKLKTSSNNYYAVRLKLYRA